MGDKNMKVICISGHARSGKDTSATIIQEHLEKEGYKVFRVAYADYLKDICKRLAGWDGVEKPRELLQTLGSDIVRNKLNMKDFWVQHVMNEIKIAQELGYTHTLITDCRYPNEIYIPKACFEKCVSVRIKRINFESELTEKQKQHESETALDHFKFDITIRATNGIENLRNIILSRIADLR